jgi:hypothetical protein
VSDSLRDALDQDEGLAEWLYNRFSSRRGADSAPWIARTPETHGYWEHEAEAVRRAVAAAHPVEPAPVASRERVAEVLARQFCEEDTATDLFDALSETEQTECVQAMGSFADALLAAGVFREEAECGAVDRTGQRRCVFTPGHHEAENWTSHGDRGGWTWNDQPAEVERLTDERVQQINGG